VPRRVTLAGLLAGVAIVVSAPAAYAVDPTDVPGDAIAPDAVTVVATPVDVDVSEEAATVVVTARVTDAGSGVSAVTVRLGDGPPVGLSTLAGDARNGDWSGTATIPQAAVHGLVTAYVDARDTAGNTSTESLHVARIADSAPAVPVSIAAEPAGTGLRVTWTPPVPNGGSPVDGYTVTAEPAVEGPVVPVTVKVPGNASEAALSGLADGVRYAVRVAATNPVGMGPSATTDATIGTAAVTTPGTPRTVVASVADGLTDVSWVPPASDGGSPITGYEVRAAATTASLPIRVAAGATTARVPGLVNGVPYDVTVAALNDLGTGIPAATTVTPRTVPKAPVVTGTVAGDRSATVKWNAPAGDGGDPIHTYVVTAHPTGTRYTLPGSARSALVGGLANGAAVTFTLTAHNDAGASPASAPSAVTTPRQPVRLLVLTKPGPAVTYGAGSHASARLTSLIGTPIAGRRVELQAQVKPSTTWRTVSAGVTDANGFVRVHTSLPATAGLRLRHPGDTFATAHAWLTTVTVAQRVTAVPSASSVRAGTTLIVTGGIGPNHPIGSRVTLQRLTSTGWLNVVDGAMTTTSGYRLTWRPRTPQVLTMRVVKHADGDHASGVSATWRQTVAPEGAAELARQIKANTRIALDPSHVSGRVDLATARLNIADVAAGRLAKRSSYENAPGGYTSVDSRLLRALRRMGERGRVAVSEIAGGSHSRGSTHYSGRGLDIRSVNGVPVSRGSSYGMAVEACRAFGAVRIFHPAYDPFGGHQGHVHCDW
jgi:hypothetical protein